MLKVAIVRPPAGYATGWKPNIERGLYLLPQALVYLSTALERAGHEVKIFDVECEEWNLNDTIKALSKFEPEVIGITSTTPSWPFSRAISIEVKKTFENVTNVLGGPHPTFEHSALKTGEADFIVQGEGEISFIKLVNSIETKKPLDVYGVISQVNDNNFYPEMSHKIDLNRFGIPSYHLINMKEYNDLKFVTISAMRGCDINCSFCLVHNIYGKPRYKNAKNMFNEVTYLNSEYDVDFINFVDPTFTLNKERINNFCELMINENQDIYWSCQTRVNEFKDESMVKKLAKAGCQGVLFGIESVTEMDLLKRGTQISDVERAFSLASKYEIRAVPSFIMGNYMDTVESIKRDIDYASWLNEKFQLDEYLQFNTLAPYPGTMIREQKDVFELEYNDKIDYAYYPVVPTTYSHRLPYEKHLDLWHQIWKIFFPEYYEDYLRIEKNAFENKIPLLDEFVQG